MKKYRMKENNNTTGYIMTDQTRANNIENSFEDLSLEEVKKE